MWNITAICLRWVQIFVIFADRPASMKIKTMKNELRWKLMMSLHAYIVYQCERDGSQQSVCHLNGCYKEESASCRTKYQQNRKRWSEDVASTGRGVVRASCIPRKKPENFFWRVRTVFCENLRQQKFPLYGIEMSHPFRQNYPHPQVNSPIVFSCTLNLCAGIPLP